MRVLCTPGGPAAVRVVFQEGISVKTPRNGVEVSKSGRRQESVYDQARLKEVLSHFASQDRESFVKAVGEVLAGR